MESIKKQFKVGSRPGKKQRADSDPSQRLSSVEDMVAYYKQDYADQTAKYEKLRDLDFFILDNSMRESTVGQLRGHTIESKWEIYEDVKKMGFHDIIVASFSYMTRVDDVFIQQLKDRGEDQSKMWAFSEMTEGKV